jgi:hypothetical protein
MFSKTFIGNSLERVNVELGLSNECLIGFGKESLRYLIGVEQGIINEKKKKVSSKIKKNK